MSELQKQEIRDAYRLLSEVEWLNVKDARLLWAKNGCEKFKSLILRSAGEICGYKIIGGRSKKSEWLNDEMRELVKDKRRPHEMYFRPKSKNDKNEYNRKNKEVKNKVREKKCMVEERSGESLSRNFGEKKQFSWKEASEERKSNDQIEM